MQVGFSVGLLYLVRGPGLNLSRYNHHQPNIYVSHNPCSDSSATHIYIDGDF